MKLPLSIFGLLLASPSYAADLSGSNNSEMAAIFKADQADRSTQPIHWDVVRAADGKRRDRTKLLLDSGALRTGDDFYEAAFVFQHGEAANDQSEIASRFLRADIALCLTERDRPS